MEEFNPKSQDKDKEELLRRLEEAENKLRKRKIIERVRKLSKKLEKDKLFDKADKLKQNAKINNRI